MVSYMSRGAESVAMFAHPTFSGHALHLGKGSEDAFLVLHDLGRLLDGHPGEGHRHEERVPLLPRRHKLGAELAVGEDRERQDRGDGREGHPTASAALFEAPAGRSGRRPRPRRLRDPRQWPQP